MRSVDRRKARGNRAISFFVCAVVAIDWIMQHPVANWFFSNDVDLFAFYLRRWPLATAAVLCGLLMLAWAAFNEEHDRLAEAPPPRPRRSRKRRRRPGPIA